MCTCASGQTSCHYSCLFLAYELRIGTGLQAYSVVVRLPDSPVACIPAPALGPHCLHYEFRKWTYSTYKILKRKMCTEMKHSPKGSVITQEVFIIQGINSNNRIYQLIINLYGRKYLAFYMRSRSVFRIILRQDSAPYGCWQFQHGNRNFEFYEANFWPTEGRN